MAAQWSVDGSYQQEFQYDDNIALRTTKTPAVGTLMRPRLQAAWKSQTTTLNVHGQSEIRRYDDEQWDCETFSLGFNQLHQLRRHGFAISGSYSQSCTYTQQISDTGLLAPNNLAENYALHPAWTWQWSTRDRLTITPSYSQIEFTSTGSGNGARSSFRGNQTYGVSLTELHRFSPRGSLNGTLFFSRSDYGGAGAVSQNLYGFQLGAEYALDRAWSIRAGGGGRWVESDSAGNRLGQDGGQSPQFGELADVELTYRGKYADSSLAFTRTINPSAIGQLTEYTSLTATYSYRLTRHLSFSLQGDYQQTDYLDQGARQSSLNRTYFSASTGLSWQFAKHWRLSGSYRYRWQEFEGTPGARDSNTVMLNVTYDWDGLRIAR